jgi:DNA-binding response OmpR family regulator
VNDAWIFATDDGSASETARAVAELGFRPLRIVPNGALRSSPDGKAGRQPAVAIIISAAGEPPPVELYRRLRGDEEIGDVPVVLSLEPGDIEDIGPLVDVDELIVRPYEPAELRARIARARRTVNGIETDDVVRLGTLEIDLATYVVTIDGRPVDFTYMEYELLKFLATHPNRAFTRESLLSRVWGYDYYGGARTVDVHVRRLRAKLGEEQAALISTVRSVGYRFGETRWGF